MAPIQDSICSRRLIMSVLLLLHTISGFAQSRSILRLPNGPQSVQMIFDSIEVQDSVLICYNKDQLNVKRMVNIPPNSTTDKALNLCLAPAGMTYEQIGNQIRVWPKQAAPPVQATPSQDTVRKHVLTIAVSTPEGENLERVSIDPHGYGSMTMTDSRGLAVVTTQTLPVHITLTHTNMQPVDVYLLTEGYHSYKMHTIITPLEEATLGYKKDKKALCTDNRSDISGQKLEFVSGATLQMILEGQVSGLQVIQPSGINSASLYLNIRGQASIFNGRSPLYVIDDVPLSCGDQSLSNFPVPWSGGSLSPFSFIAVADIVHIQILKDADATSIYGSRGANGVILISTRRGQAGKPRFNLQLSEGISQVAKILPLMNTHEYLSMRREAFRNDNVTMTDTNAPDLLDWDTTRYTNWGKYFLGGLGKVLNVQSSVSGGNNLYTYLFGLSYLRETSLFPTNPIHQRINPYVNFNYEPSDSKLRIQFFGLFAGDINNQFLTGDPTKLQFLAPNAPALQDAQGNLVFRSKNAPFANPLSLLEQTYRARSYNILTSGHVSYQFCRELTLKLALGYNKLKVDEYGQVPISTQDPSTHPTGSSDFAWTHYTGNIVEPQLEFIKKYRQLQLTVLGGYSWQKESGGFKSIIAQGFTSDSWLKKPSLAPYTDSSQASSSYNYQAEFGRVNLNWADTYILNFTGRRDGSSRFGSNEKFGLFGAGAFAWIFTNESFAKGLRFLSYGKFRVSYGVTGNDQIGSHSIDTWAPAGTPVYQNIPGFSTSQVGSGLTYEVIRKTDISMELGFNKNRILFTLSYYQNRSSNQLLPAGYPTAGDSIVYNNENHVVLENRGWEMELTAKLIRGKNFDWSLSLNGTLPQSKLLSFPGLDVSPFARDLIVGHSINTLRGYRNLGVDKTTGLYQFQDLNHDGRISDSDRTILGKLDLTAFGGIENTFRYKDFLLSFLFDFRKGIVPDYQIAYYFYNPPGSRVGGDFSNAPKDFTNHWSKQDDVARFQRPSTGTLGPTSGVAEAISRITQSNALLSDASMIRLRKVSIAYHVSQDLLDKTPLVAATIYFMAQNLVSFSPNKGLSSEIQSATILPPLRVFEVGIRVSI
jgi:TonB-linked SusC/RagA family outer membrane protein